MTEQGAFFELGDAAGDELARTSEDGATWTEPSLWQQQGRTSTPAELASDAAAAELLGDARARMAEHRDACPVELYQLPGITEQWAAVCHAAGCGWSRQTFDYGQARRFGIAHDIEHRGREAHLADRRRGHRSQQIAERKGQSRNDHH